MSSVRFDTQIDPNWKASRIDLLISDLPPPDTVAGLWQWVGSGEVPTRCHCVRSVSRCLAWTR